MTGITTAKAAAVITAFAFFIGDNIGLCQDNGAEDEAYRLGDGGHQDPCEEARTAV